MKLTVFFLFIALTQISAKGYSQTVTISGQNMSLTKIFRDIQKQTGYHFLCTKEQLAGSKRIDLSLKNAPLTEVLNQAFSDQPLSYSILNNTIIVRKRHPANDVEDITLATLMQITGKVTDSASGKPLAGVTIKVKDNTNGTVTDPGGQFTLDVPEDAILEISYLGYERKEVNVNGRSSINISLSPITTGLNQLVVVGYGVQKKVNITGAVSTIDSKDLSKRVVNNSVQALQGLAPNLNIAANNDAGAADGTMDMNVRGVGSLSSSEPYILIDGVRATKAEFSSMDPNNIENISVLKDAASAAIYGAQAAYGVILVQTKKGRKGEKLQIGVSSDLSWSKLMYVPESLNSLKYIDEINQAAKNYSNQLFITEETLEKAKAFRDGTLKYGTEQDPNNPNQWLGILSGTSIAWYTGFANTSWWKELYKDFSFRENHNVYVSGGTEKLTYYVSGGLLQDYGQFRYGDKNENFSRLNYNSSVSADITKWLTISNTTRFYQKNNKFPATLEGASRGRLFHDMMRWSPLVPLKTPPVKDDDGNIIVPEQLTTLAAFNENNGFDKYKEEDLVTTFKVDIKISDALSVKGDYTFKKNWYSETLNFKKWVFYGPDGNPSIIYQNNQDEISKDLRKSDYTSFNIYANFDKSYLDKHNLNILVGYQQEENKYEGFQVGRKNVIANYLNSLNVAVGDIIGLANPISSWATLGAFGRVSYNFEEKYLFEFNSRYDGSSKFPGDHRFGFFPSVSVGYNINKEDFWKPLSNVINSMKIRASFGKLGNQNVSGNLYLSGIPVNTQLGWAIGGERPVYTNMPGIVSPDVTWETSTTKNIGADLAVLNYRLTASIDVYQRQTDNMFGPSSALPSVLGTSPPKTNSASLATTGWELSIGWTDAIKDFNYNVKFLLSDNVSKITKYNNPTKVLSDWYVGQTMGEIWGFKVDNLFQSESEVDKYTTGVDLSYFGTGWQPGDVKYLDLNGDGKVNVGENTADNPGDRFIIGNDYPRYQVALSAGASWKGFDFYMLWQGVGKRDLFLDDYATLFWGWNDQGHSRLTEASLDHWSKDNPNGYLPIPLLSGGRSGFAKDRYPSTRYLLNGAYLRLRSLNLGYTLPTSLTQRVNINNLRFYVSGQNLLTLTKLWPTLDPELIYTGTRSRTGDGRAYPLSQVYTVGFDVTF